MIDPPNSLGLAVEELEGALTFGELVLKAGSILFIF
jgi:hypothetical protein